MNQSTLEQASLASRLRSATGELHRGAERSGIMQVMLRGKIGPREYGRLLRNFHALYVALERGLDRHAAHPLVAPLRMPAMYRAPALAADLQFHLGAGWQDVPLATATQHYVARLHAIAADQPALLVAHAYVRYLGDLSGGQLLAGLMRKALAITGSAGTAFYEFGPDPAPAELKARFRAALDTLPVDAQSAAAIVQEACAAFQRHIDLFMELDPASAACAQVSMPPPAA